MIKVKNNKKFGNHIVATKNIKKKMKIGETPIIIFDKRETNLISKTKLKKYVYEYTFGKNQVALAVGEGSFFNHSEDANALFVIKKNKIIYFAKKDIKKDEQIFINYGYNPF